MTDSQRMLLALLVMDLGYREEPRYGHSPLRHQFAWKFATEGIAPNEVAEAIARRLKQIEIER